MYLQYFTATVIAMNSLKHHSDSLEPTPHAPFSQYGVIRSEPGANSISNSTNQRPEPGHNKIKTLSGRQHSLWHGYDFAGQGQHRRSTGFASLDAILPGQGWPQKGLMEVIAPCWGTGELQLLMPLMRDVIAKGQWILWVSPPFQLYAPALEQAGIDTEQIRVIDLDTSCKNALCTMEKALQDQHCGLVLAWQRLGDALAVTDRVDHEPAAWAAAVDAPANGTTGWNRSWTEAGQAAGRGGGAP